MTFKIGLNDGIIFLSRERDKVFFYTLAFLHWFVSYFENTITYY